ncbi:Hypothetical Protein FCC1311_039442 [Hondaea fermentalgiana]|uniref:PHTF1/2 N-terminal domain-containing protein n=1 Tax=Hondaea fermentalgiana TaxID=2315210 RepID=A0A2R5GHF4_9STRA|nr:Hypothetical Protein FCC1311_039442 [Hondaea fermentalgiana]|eukprot:GBG27721.1 Hypothetical Protein FCC1311_039442 [Hondaea fermentalgiana]
MEEPVEADNAGSGDAGGGGGGGGAGSPRASTELHSELRVRAGLGGNVAASLVEVIAKPVEEERRGPGRSALAWDQHVASFLRRRGVGGIAPAHAERLKKSHSSGSIVQYSVAREGTLFTSDDEDEASPAKLNGHETAPAAAARFANGTRNRHKPGADEDTEDEDTAYAHAHIAVARVAEPPLLRDCSADSLIPETLLGPGRARNPLALDEDIGATTPGSASQASSGIDDTSTEGEDNISLQKSEDSRPQPLHTRSSLQLDERLVRERSRQFPGSRMTGVGIMSGSRNDVGVSSVSLRLDDEEDSDFDLGEYDSSASPDVMRAKSLASPRALGGPEMFDFDIMKRKTRIKPSKKLDRPSVRKGQMWTVRVLLFPLFLSWWSGKLKTRWLIVSLMVYMMQLSATTLYWLSPEEPSEVTRYEIVSSLILLLVVAFMLGHCAAVSNAVTTALKKEREDVPPAAGAQANEASAFRPDVAQALEKQRQQRQRQQQQQQMLQRRLQQRQQAEQLGNAQQARGQGLRQPRQNGGSRMPNRSSTAFSVGSVKYVTDHDDYDEEDDSISSDEEEQTDLDEVQNKKDSLEGLGRPLSQKTVTSARSAAPALGLRAGGGTLSGDDERPEQAGAASNAEGRARPISNSSAKSSASSPPSTRADASHLAPPVRGPDILHLGSGSAARRRPRLMHKTSSVRSLLWSSAGPQESTLSVSDVRNRIYERISMSKLDRTRVRIADISVLAMAALPTLFRCAESVLPALCWFADQPESAALLSFGGFDTFLQESVCAPALLQTNGTTNMGSGSINITSRVAQGGLDTTTDPLVCYIADQERCEHTMLEAMIAAASKRYDKQAIFISFSSMLATLFLLAIFFQFVVIAEEIFRRRLLYAKYFGQLTSSRRSQKARLPHFRLNRVNHIRVWLDLRNDSREAHNSTYQFGDAAANTLVIVTLTVVARVCLRLFSGAWSFQRLDDWATLLLSTTFSIFMYRFMNLASDTQKKYNASARVLYTEQLNIYIQLFANPANKEELVACNNMLKIAIKLLSSESKPGKDAYKAILLNPVVYNLFRVTILSAMGTMSSDVLGFKVRLWKI